jgi:hypothetical protein
MGPSLPMPIPPVSILMSGWQRRKHFFSQERAPAGTHPYADAYHRVRERSRATRNADGHRQEVRPRADNDNCIAHCFPFSPFSEDAHHALDAPFLCQDNRKSKSIAPSFSDGCRRFTTLVERDRSRTSVERVAAHRLVLDRVGFASACPHRTPRALPTGCLTTLDRSTDSYRPVSSILIN